MLQRSELFPLTFIKNLLLFRQNTFSFLLASGPIYRSLSPLRVASMPYMCYLSITSYYAMNLNSIRTLSINNDLTFPLRCAPYLFGKPNSKLFDCPFLFSKSHCHFLSHGELSSHFKKTYFFTLISWFRYSFSQYPIKRLALGA